MEGNLVKITRALAVAFLVLAMVLNIIPDKRSTVTNVTTQTEAEAGTVSQTEAD